MKADPLNFRNHFKILIVCVRIWFSIKLRCLYESSISTNNKLNIRKLVEMKQKKSRSF